MKTNQRLVLAFFLLSIMFGVFSCRKEGNIKDPTDNFSKNKNVAIAKWLDDHKQTSTSTNDQTLNLLKPNLDYSNINILSRKNGDSIIIIPINESVKTHLNENAKYLKLNENSNLNLIIVQNKEGKLKWSSIISFLPSDGKNHSKLSAKTIQSIINNEPVLDDGMFKFINLKGRLSYQLEYKNGRLYSYGLPIRKDQLPTKNAQKAVKDNSIGISSYAVLPENCIDYFLVTTYYDGVGGTYDEWEYLYTICDDGGGSGGGGDNGEPEEENDMEIEISGSTVITEDDYIEDDYAIEEGNSSVNHHGVPTPIEFEGYWTGIRMAISRRITSLSMTNLMGYPVNETYYNPRQRASILRHLQWTTTGKWHTIHQPLGVTATLEWGYDATVRYTNLSTGVSTYRYMKNRTHQKFIGLFD